MLKTEQEIKYIQAKQLTSIKKLFVFSVFQLGTVAYEEETSDGACLHSGLSHENDSVHMSDASQMPCLTPSHTAAVFPLSSSLALCTFIPSRALLSIFQVGLTVWLAGFLQISAIQIAPTCRRQDPVACVVSSWSRCPIVPRWMNTHPSHQWQHIQHKSSS